MKTIRRIVFLTVSGALLGWIAGLAIFVCIMLALPSDPSGNAPVAIVLTGSEGRVESGLNMLANGDVKEIFISGVHPDVIENDIKLLHKNAEKPLPDCCITLGRRATTTRENAAESVQWLKEKNIADFYLVTSDYHMPRAWLEFTIAEPQFKITPRPLPDFSNAVSSRKLWALIVSEYHKIIFRIITLPFDHL